MSQGMLNSVYDANPEGYDALRRCWLNDRRERFVEERLRRAATPPASSVLEIGSGTGWLIDRLARAFSGWSFFGVEPLVGYVDYASRTCARRNVRFSVGTGEKLPPEVTTESVDFILSNDVLHHVNSLTETIREAARVARPGARWLAIEPNASNPYTLLRQACRPGERNFWPRRFLREAGALGWTLKFTRYLFLVPPGIQDPPRWMKILEDRLEGVPFLAGGVALELERLQSVDR